MVKKKRVKGKKGKTVGQAKFYNKVSSLEKFIETSKLKYLNKFFFIEKISLVAKLFFYMGLTGSILVVLSLFFSFLWVYCWIYFFISIILLGFIFAKPGTKYNFVLILGIFIGLMFTASVYREALLSTTLDVNSPRSPPRMLTTQTDIDDSREQIRIRGNAIKTELKDEYTMHDLRARILINDWSYDQCHALFKDYVDSSLDLSYELRTDLAYYYNHVGKIKDEYSIDVIIEWEMIVAPYIRSGVTRGQIRNLIIDGARSVTYGDVKGYYSGLSAADDKILHYYVDLLNLRYTAVERESDGDILEREERIGDDESKTDDDDNDDPTFDISGFMNSIDKLSGNPLDDLAGFVSNFIDVMNWIVFLAILAYGGAAVANGITLNIGNAIKKLAYIALAIAIMTFIYSMFLSIEIEVRTVWDTVGDAWNTLMSKLGFAMMDASGNTIVTANSTVDGIYRIIPIIFSFACLGMAYGFRKTDLESVIFVKTVTKDNMIEVERAGMSISSVVILLGMGIYLIGYFLITAKPEVVFNPYITLAFYLVAFMIIIFMGNKFLIVNMETSAFKKELDEHGHEKVSWKSDLENILKFAWKTGKWTVFGLMGLFLWFGVFQPAMLQLNLTDTSSSLFVLSQDKNLFETDFMQQLFLVAAPETLIFQIGFIGLGNRIYFYLKKTRISRIEEKRLRAKRWELAIQFQNLKIKISSSKENVKRIAKGIVLKQKIDELGQILKQKQKTKVSIKFFILSTGISSLIGSFLFSTYHSYRRGLSFAQWWQNPLYGLTYFGAGFFLCLIAFFSWPAAILVHAFNNIIAIFMTGG